MRAKDALPSVTELTFEEICIRRWKTCLHEAGHAVAGRHLLKRTTRAAVFGNGAGVADLGGGNDVPVSFREVKAAAAVPLETAYPQNAGRLAAGVAKMMPDETAIARWCIQGRESQPRLWSRRHRWVYSAAAEFVSEYQREIVAVAAQLYEKGVVTLLAETP